jgi:purine-binding chemotaxis protein CheW
LAESERAVSFESQINLACFEVRGRSYALEIAQVREIVRLPPITPLPKAPALIEGVIELRGSVVPVIDLGRALVGEPVDRGPRARVMVFELDGLLVGLCVDAAVDVLSLDVHALEDPPALATHAGYDAVRSVVRRPGATPVMVLSLEHIVESVYRSALGGEAAA